ncbi:multidrug ABC transporter [Butyrivibrio sp. FCS014]|uniref:multidrug ABC transporter n=1 Tax=Butyrivibrio sp. FCS014 TaxID=1408304 RepID=UPI0004BB60E1|nr:multidrug ABC transporter [Butyrivibrio sp. FCS014]
MINVFFIIMIFAELLASTSQILLKKSAQKEYPSFIREYLNILVIGGYGLLVLSMVLSIFCYGGLGYMGVVVMEPMAYIMVMILSRIVFKEKITPRKIIGVVLILAGIVVFYTLG